MARLMGHLPPHHHYVSVFGGSGADILCKPPSKTETYNDIDQDLANVFRVLREPAQRRHLSLLIRDTLPSRLGFREALDTLSDSQDPVLRAWAYLVVAEQSWGCTHPSVARPLSYGYVVKPHGKRRWATLPQRIEWVAERFRRVESIECLPWQEIFLRYDRPTTFFYCDPPYPFGTRAAKKIYAYEMSDSDHEEFLVRVCQLRGHVAVSSYDNPLYNRYLGDWTRLEFVQPCNISWRSKKPPRVEIVWIKLAQA
jgi:DNA adenine methylase